jgi:hypothetical protein
MARTHDLPRSGRGATLGQDVVAPRPVTAIDKRRLHCGNGVQIEIDRLTDHSTEFSPVDMMPSNQAVSAGSWREINETCG